MNNNSLNGTSATSTSTSTTYNISNTCKYRLPCGWCDRRNCLCTYAGLGYTYAVVNGTDFGSVYQTRSDSVDGVVTTATNSAAKSNTSDDNRVDVGAENRGFVATTETFLQR